MSESKELKQIKKLYGEKFMHLCREIFPTLLEQEGLLTKVLTSTFSTNSKTLYEDIKENELEEEFKSYIYSKVDVEKGKPEIIEEKTPYELLEEVGYDLYECHTEEEIQKFKKYYKPGEELCTFGGERLDRCVVFWAVKKDAEKIRREDFKNPKREDEYGTSVMSIQFNRKGKCTVSIKNRYNHTVNNPDATYGNDLDRIKTGLEKSFAKLLQKEYGLELNSTNKEEFEIPGYTVAGDGKYYKYNMEINGIYYCPGNIIINQGTIEHLEPEKQILIDYFILDKENKKIELYEKGLEDSFIDGFKDIEVIEVRKANEKEKGARIITIKKHNSDKPIIIKIDKENQIKSYINEELIEVENYFLYYNGGLNQLELPKLKEVGNYFLNHNKELSQLVLPNLEVVGNYFLNHNKELSHLELPNLEVVGAAFLNNNKGLSQLELPNLENAGDYFLYNNTILSQLELPSLEKVGDFFLGNNIRLIKLGLPKLKEVGHEFLYYNKELSHLELPNLEKVGYSFLGDNRKLSQLELPNLEKIGDFFLGNNIRLIKLGLPNLEKVRDFFLYNNEGLSQLESPKLKEVGDSCLHRNKDLSQLELPKLKEVGNSFLRNNERLSQLELPNLEKVGDYFLSDNKELSQLELPKLKEVGSDFLYFNEALNQIELPNLTEESKEKLQRIFNVVEKNKKETQKSEIKPKDMAELDKDNSITITEINDFKKIIEREIDSNDKTKD